MLATILALKAWAVYRIAKMVSSFVTMARLASLRKYAVVKRSFDIMLEKLCWGMLYGIRGGIYALPVMLLSLVFTFINKNLNSVTEYGSFVFINNYLSNVLMYLSFGALAAAAVVWIMTWVSDYRSDYLPNWIRRDLY